MAKKSMYGRGMTSPAPEEIAAYELLNNVVRITREEDDRSITGYQLMGIRDLTASRVLIEQGLVRTVRNNKYVVQATKKGIRVRQELVQTFTKLSAR